MREEAFQSVFQLQVEEQRARSIADQSRLDAESCVGIFKKDLSNAHASEQPCSSSLEDERAACRGIAARLAVIEMRAHDSERAPAGSGTLRLIPCSRGVGHVEATAALPRQSNAMMRVREGFNEQIIADNQKTEPSRRHIAKGVATKLGVQGGTFGNVVSVSVGVSHTAPALAALARRTVGDHLPAGCEAQSRFVRYGASGGGGGAPDLPGGATMGQTRTHLPANRRDPPPPLKKPNNKQSTNGAGATVAFVTIRLRVGARG